jgi:hypothetical protein
MTEISGNNPTASNTWVGDQFTEIVDFFLTENLNSGKLLANPVAIDAKQFDLTGGHGAIIGNTILICETVDGLGRCYQATILNVATNTITVDSPLDENFTTDADVIIGNKNLNIDGSTATKIATISPPTGTKWDITRLVVHIEDETSMDSAKFGGLPALTNGIVLRHKNNVINNIFTVKSNGEFGERAYDIEYDPKAPAGVFGFRCRRSFGGQDKNGVVIRLDGSLGDELQVLISDDLTGLTLHRYVIQGHVTTTQGGL